MTCMNRYLNLHRKKDCIIPYILVHDHPNDLKAAGVRYMEAIFEYYYTENKWIFFEWPIPR